LVGIGVAGMLRAEGFKNVTIIEPKGIHYYQPLWTLVGGGLKEFAESHRPMRSLLSKETKWIQKPIKSFDPKNCLIELNDETKVPYDYLVVALGVVTRFDKIPGAEKALNDKESGVISVYDPNYVVKTSHVLSELREGKAIFTMPTTPVTLLCLLL
jgi:NADH dehydrogenase FAD-containing subunit